MKLKIFSFILLFWFTYSQGCGDYKHYIPTDPVLYPTKYIKVNFWVIQDSSNIYANFSNTDTARKVLYDLIGMVNWMLSENRELVVNFPNIELGKHYIKDTLHLRDTRFRYKVVPNSDSLLDPDRDGIIFINDPYECYFAPTDIPGKGKRVRIIYPPGVRIGLYSTFARKYGKDDVINIFIRAVHPVTMDTIQKINGRVTTWGWSNYYDNYVTIIGLYQAVMGHDTKGKFQDLDVECLKKNNYDTTKCILTGQHYKRIIFEYGKLLNHEIAHLLGLRHITSYDGVDGTDCKDTPRVPALIGKTTNIMDYVNQVNYTSCQLGLIHKNLLCIPNLFKKLYPDFCDYDSVNVITIDKDVTFYDIKCLNKDIVVEPYATLTINNKLYLPKEARIIVKPNGRVIINNGIKIKVPCSGEEWNNFEVISEKNLFKKSTGKVILRNNEEKD